MAAAGLEFDDLPVDRSIRELIARFLDGGGVFIAQHVTHAGCIVATKVIILIKDADSGFWILAENVSGIKPCSQPVARSHAADRVGCLLVIAPAVSAALDEQLRNLSVVEILRDRELRGRSDRAVSEGDLLHFDELARLVAGSPRQVAVVDTDQV